MEETQQGGLTNSPPIRYHVLQLFVCVNNNCLGLQISFFHSTYHDAYVPETILKELCTEAEKLANEEQARSVNLYGFIYACICP